MDIFHSNCYQRLSIHFTNYHFFENTIMQVDQIGRTAFTIPYLDGGTSISRVSRTFPQYLIFKPSMILTGFLLMYYWNYNNALINKLKNTENLKYRFRLFGILSAIFLIIHSIFLGIKFDYQLYKLFRRVILLLFIIFEIIAQGILVYHIYKIKNKINEISNKRVLNLKIALVSLLASVAILSLPILIDKGNTHFKHGLEWNFLVGVIIFYSHYFSFGRELNF